MGRTMQERLVRKRDLELMLSKVTPHPLPAVELEQYTISADTAATMLYIAAYIHKGIVGKRVIDLGCGTGRLGLGAAFIGAKEVLGVDIDKTSVRKAHDNSIKLNLKKTEWVATDIDSIRGHFDTVLQNPPFGVQKRGADRRFILKALELADVIFSLHKRPGDDASLLAKLRASSDGAVRVSASSFMEKLVEENSGRIDCVYALLMTIPHIFSFHTEKRHEFLTDLYVIRSK
jgi:putative methylase